MSNFPTTPHINIANEIGFGKTVLMPGDPCVPSLLPRISWKILCWSTVSAASTATPATTRV